VFRVGGDSTDVLDAGLLVVRWLDGKWEEHEIKAIGASVRLAGESFFVVRTDPTDSTLVLAFETIVDPWARVQFEYGRKRQTRVNELAAAVADVEKNIASLAGDLQVERKKEEGPGNEQEDLGGGAEKASTDTIKEGKEEEDDSLAHELLSWCKQKCLYEQDLGSLSKEQTVELSYHRERTRHTLEIPVGVTVLQRTTESLFSGTLLVWTPRVHRKATTYHVSGQQEEANVSTITFRVPRLLPTSGGSLLSLSSRTLVVFALRANGVITAQPVGVAGGAKIVGCLLSDDAKSAVMTKTNQTTLGFIVKNARDVTELHQFDTRTNEWHETPLILTDMPHQQFPLQARTVGSNLIMATTTRCWLASLLTGTCNEPTKIPCVTGQAMAVCDESGLLSFSGGCEGTTRVLSKFGLGGRSHDNVLFQGRAWHSVVSRDSRHWFVLGGVGMAKTFSSWELVTADSEWNVKSVMCGSMNQARFGRESFDSIIVDNKLYAIGGDGRGTVEWTNTTKPFRWTTLDVPLDLHDVVSIQTLVF